jgi:hypothetical protein
MWVRFSLLPFWESSGRTHFVRKLSLVLVVLLSSQTLAGEGEPTVAKRGWLSGLGVGLVGLAGVGFGLGATGVIGNAELSRKLDGYRALGSAATNNQLATLGELESQAKTNSLLITAGFIGGGLALAGGITCLILDIPKVPEVAFVPMQGGGFLSVQGRF